MKSSLEKNHVLTHLLRNIRTQASDPTIKNLCERIEKGRLIPRAEFQRNFVWKNNTKIKSRLIESVFLDVPIPTIYTAEEEDGTEVVIDGQQRLLTFFTFLKNEYRLNGLEICEELNHKNYRALQEIDINLQEKIDEYPLRIIKILKDSDPSVRFDIFERLNRGSVKLNDQELRNCIYRGSFNDFIKEIIKNKDFQSLLGSKEHRRMQDAEFALRFFSLYELTYLKYKPPIRGFLNSFMSSYRNSDRKKLDEFRSVFKKTAYLVKTVFGERAFNLYTIQDNMEGKRDKRINQGLFDVLMIGFTDYDQNQIMPYKDSLKEELMWLMVHDKDFITSISGAGTGTKEKFSRKIEIWKASLKGTIGTPKTEPRSFSWELKFNLWEKQSVCAICHQQIETVEDAEIDHIHFYWRGGKTIPENARLVHRYCNRARRDNSNTITSNKNPNKELDGKITKTENLFRKRINAILSENDTEYWDSNIPENISKKVRERVHIQIRKHPYERDSFNSPEKKLEFCDIFDYLKIIKGNWGLFMNVIVSKESLEKHINSLNDLRNTLRHGREPNKVIKKSGEAAIEWFNNVLNV
ncbi:MAG: DUF262 domain-containing protein [Thermodesulfobacteriota bacterium]|nr:DUF262 domain-containing protein [Thermodesulfobacteriota bacterium]